MSHARKDIRAKLDEPMHAALALLADVDQVDIGEFVERELVRVIRERLHVATVVSAGAARLGITGNRRENQGSIGRPLHSGRGR